MRNTEWNNSGKVEEKLMDMENLTKIKELIDEIIGENEPTDEELNYDDNWIEVYDELHNLKVAMENVGL